MKSKYYLYGTILGLCLVPAVAIFILGWKDFGTLLPDWHISLPLVLGYSAAFLAGLGADRLTNRRGLIATVFLLVGIFLFGVFIGCLANLLLNGQLLQPRFGLFEEIWDWFFKPAYWLTVIGAPCAVAVGVMYYLAQRLYRRWRHGLSGL